VKFLTLTGNSGNYYYSFRFNGSVPCRHQKYAHSWN